MTLLWRVNTGAVFTEAASKAGADPARRLPQPSPRKEECAARLPQPCRRGLGRTLLAKLTPQAAAICPPDVTTSTPSGRLGSSI
ncbi:hypothetical protein RRG08_054882 [Elysia crispata]|uniref:Uncharacterized protein n=1 Tax=Elysia crispata TaxID=231223 RepID=A0AAE1DTY8_9GAST|nr:hypothetical protein RRG08_054882 [Elysia crispata]